MKEAGIDISAHEPKTIAQSVKESGIKLPHDLALVFEDFLFQLARVAIQHPDRLLSSV
jgi:hypothetical protein